MVGAGYAGAIAPSVVMCVDEEAAHRPEAIGLSGESLAAQPWLKVVSSGASARECVRSMPAPVDAWVVSSDDIDPINLAAAIKRDGCAARVSLVAFESTGSLMSRAKSAGIDAVIGLAEFAMRYRDAKRRFANAAARPQVAVPAVAQTSEDALTGGRRPSGQAASFSEAPVRAIPGGNVLYRATSTASDHSAFIMPVVSGSGGSGKSTVAVLAAYLCQRIGYRTALVDLDLQFGDVMALVGRDEAVRVDDLIETPALIARLDAEPGGAPAIIGAPRRLERAEAVARDVGALIDALAARFDVVVANTGSLWGEQHAAVLERSSKAVFLIDQRPSSLRACQHALELCARCGIATGPFLFAVNRCERGALYTSIDASCALRGAKTVELAEGGFDVEDALAAGRPDDLIDDDNDLCESIREMLEGTLPGCAERMAAHASSRPRMKRLFGRRRAKARAACL